MARFLVGRGVGAASLWVARDNLRARRFYERLGGVVCAEREETRPGFVLAEVAYAWRDLSIASSVGQSLSGPPVTWPPAEPQ
jgi:hypothetical protein